MPNDWGTISVERMDRAVDKVRDRLLRATAVLEQAALPYAVIGGHAVAAWVSRVDESLVRYTRDVDILIRRVDFEQVKAAFEGAGLVSRHAAGIEMFLESRSGKARDGVHVLFAGEKVRPEDPYETPNLDECERTENFRFIALESLVRMKLTSFRLKDQVHLLDLIQAGLVEESMLARLPSDLASRLKPLIDNPNA
ncbi:MAG: hypothetical protein ACKV0T_05045 [Planctomycetales bacterium]